METEMTGQQRAQAREQKTQQFLARLYAQTPLDRMRTRQNVRRDQRMAQKALDGQMRLNALRSRGR
jgi:hypothetical protein